LPIIQYHHIVEWKEDQHYRAEDMMVLCPLHHDQATKGALPEARQREFKAQPENIRRGRAKGLLAINQDYCAAELGSVTVVGEGPFLKIRDKELLSFYVGNENLEISARLYGASGELLVEIDRNEWVSGNPLPWDIEADWQRLTLRERIRNVNLMIDARKIPMEVRGEFWEGEGHFVITPREIRMGIAGEPPTRMGVAELALVGFVLQIDPDKRVVNMSPNRENALLISWPNRRERLYRARDAWRRISREGGNAAGA
jgi:hypothetical protein